MSKREILVNVVVAIIGLAIWIVISSISDQKEAWDNNLFFVVGLPIMMLTTFIAGYIEPRHSWIYGLAVIILQLLALLVGNEISPFLFVGIVFFVFFTGAGAISAYLGAFLRHKLDIKRIKQKLK